MIDLSRIEKIMKDISYGYTDKNGTVHTDFGPEFSDYRLQSPEELLKSKYGICWDTVELQRELLKEYNPQTYFVVYYDDYKCPSHTFITFEKNGKFYWYEYSWEMYRGLHEYDLMQDLINILAEKHLKKCIKWDGVKNPDVMQLCVYKYSKPEYGIPMEDFGKHCESGEIVSYYIDLKKIISSIEGEK